MPTFPPGWARAPPEQRVSGSFQVTLAKALRDLQRELQQMGAQDVRVDTDVPTRQDGMPYSDQREPADPGVVVYWSKHGRKYAIACDRYKKIAANVRAVGLTIAAKRAILRYGAATDVAEYRGYEALPPPGETTYDARRDPPPPPPPPRPHRDPHEVLHIAKGAPPAVVRAAFRALAHTLHPDRGGGDAAALQEAIEARNTLLRGGSP